MINLVSGARWSARIVVLVASLAGVTRAVELADVVELVEPSVVRIDTDTGVGSGVLVDAKGLVITNFHVMHGAQKGKATFSDGKAAEIKGFVACESGHDLILVQLGGTSAELRPIKIAKSLPRKGEKVAAFGAPKGLSFSASEGIVAAIRGGNELEKTLEPGLYEALGYDVGATWIQTTAAISPGNSGGPLVTMNGELVGLNTWSKPDGQSLNFAISVTDIQRVISQATELTPLASLLPRETPSKKSRPRNLSTSRKFKIELPSGRVFSFDIFDVDMRLYMKQLRAASDVAVLEHTSGKTFAYAQHRGGKLNGLSVALYENGDPMTYANYDDGKRHGLLKTWDEAGRPVYWGQYFKDKRQGFCCFFSDGAFRLLCEYEHDVPTAIHVLSGSKIRTFATRSEAEQDPATEGLLKHLDECETKLKVNERAFKKKISVNATNQRKRLSGAVKRGDVDIPEYFNEQERAFYMQLVALKNL